MKGNRIKYLKEKLENASTDSEERKFSMLISAEVALAQRSYARANTILAFIIAIATLAQVFVAISNSRGGMEELEPQAQLPADCL